MHINVIISRLSWSYEARRLSVESPEAKRNPKLEIESLKAERSPEAGYNICKSVNVNHTHVIRQ